MAKGKRIPVDGSAENEPSCLLGELLRERGLAPEEKPPAQVPAGTAAVEKSVPVPGLANAGKMVLRVQRKGMGGKTVTVLSCPALPHERMESLAKELRKALGCGSRVEDGDIVLQGDVAGRAARWLRDRGARQVVGGF